MTQWGGELMRKISKCGIGGRGRSKKCYFPSDKLFCELQAYTDLCPHKDILLPKEENTLILS